MVEDQKGAVGRLTDGTGVSPLTANKLIKDAAADFLLALPAALIAVGITGVPQDTQTGLVAIIAIVGVLVRAAYRAALRWATT